jgi:hypothetical protein
VATKQRGKKHGKGFVKLGDGFVSVAYGIGGRRLVPDSRTVKTWNRAIAIEESLAHAKALLTLGTTPQRRINCK